MANLPCGNVAPSPKLTALAPALYLYKIANIMITDKAYVGAHLEGHCAMVPRLTLRFSKKEQN